MPEETQNQPSEKAEAETHEAGSDEQALAAMLALDAPEASQTEADPDENESDDSSEEADKADPQDDTETDEELVDFEFEGETLKVSAATQEKLQKSVLR